MKTPASAASRPVRNRLPVAALWVASLLAYSNSFQAGLVFDNASRILEDPRIQAATSGNIGLIFQSDYWHPIQGSGLYRPLTSLSFLLNYAVLGNGPQPAGYHMVNWLLHALNATLLYFLALRLLKDQRAAFAVAGIWAVHPVLTESVTNVVGRADVLAGLGVFGGLLAYIESTSGIGRARWKWLAVASLVAAVGVFSKESAIVVLGAAALYDLCARRRPFLPGYAALALPAAVYWMVRAQVFANVPARLVPFTDNPLVGAGFVSAKLTAIKIVGRELLLLLWPASLSVDYSYNQIPLSSASDSQAWAALAACLGLAGVALFCYRKKHPAFFWIAFTFLTLAPTSNLAVIIGAPMADRFLYLPAIGFAGCLVAAVPRTRAAHILLAAIAVILTARTFVRNFDWKDEKSLWTSAAAASPASYKTHLTMAAMVPIADPPALRETEAAIAIVDGLPDALNTPLPYINGGKLYRDRGDYQKALRLLERAARIRAAGEPRNDAAFAFTLYQEMGRVYTKLSRFDEAGAAFRSALRLRQAPELYEELSAAYLRGGDSSRAIIALLEGILSNPGSSKLASQVANLYQQIDPAGCALQTVNGQSGLNLNCPPVHEHFCAAAVDLVRLYREAGEESAAGQTSAGAVRTLRCDAQLFRP